MNPSSAPPTTSTIGYGIDTAAGERAQPGHGDQQSGDQELGFAHGRIIAPIARAKPILLAAAMAFLALNVWTGSPLLAVWLGSQVQGEESQPSMGAYAVVILAR